MRCRAIASTLLLGAAFLSWAPSAGAAGAAKPYDFDGNGHPELVVGAPDLRVTSAPRTGGVVILSASADGLSMTEKVVNQSSRGLPGASETGDRFGQSVASADFDQDGYADLAIGQPSERIGTLVDAGAVTVVYGSARGLNTARSVGITSPSGASESAFFGEGLVAGDFDDDGYPDLAIGEPAYNFPPIETESTGTVTLLRGGPTGVQTTDAIQLDQEQGDPQNWQLAPRFGAVLAAGDLDADGVTDLVVGSSGPLGVGSVSYCLGKVGGPDNCTRLVFGGDLRGMTTLVVGNLRGTSRPQIVAGAPEGIGVGGGIMLITLTTGTPLALDDLENLNQATPGIPGSDERGDRFGSSLAVGNIDRDDYDDLVVGTDREDRGEGRVTVIHGSPAGIRTTGNYLYDQNTPGIPGATESEDRFGSAVTLLDHDQDGRLDLTVGARGENGNGAITTLRGSGTAFTTRGSRTFGLPTLGYAYPAQAQFGAVLGR